MVQGETAEVVAYALMRDVLMAQGKLSTVPSRQAEKGLSEAEILNLFHRCLLVARGQEPTR